MTRSRQLKFLMAGAAVVVFVVVALSGGQDKEAAPPSGRPAKRNRPAVKPIAMSRGTASLEIRLGLKDTKRTLKDKKLAVWDGTVEVSKGRVVEIESLRGNTRQKSKDGRFKARSQLNPKQVVRPQLRVHLDAPESAVVTVSTEKQGKFQFKLADLAVGASKLFLDGQVQVEREQGAVRLTGPETEEDYPAAAKGKDGTTWLAYVAYQPARPLVMERVKAGNFEELEPKDNGDHDNGFGSEYMWWHFQKVTELFQHPPRFTAMHVYERSVPYPNGHRNVIFPRPGIRPLPRESTPVAEGTPEKGATDTKLLYAYLKHFGAICSSHTSATQMGTDWRDNDPDVEPVVEIYQGCRHNYEHSGAPRAADAKTQIGGYRPKGFVWNALEKGYRLGFQASSDHVSTHMSYAVVLTDDVSRQGIIDAFKKRHSYGATDNIVLDVRSGDHLMGDRFTTAKRPVLDVRVHGTGPIAKVHVIRDNKYVYTAEPKEQKVTLRFTDMDAKEGKSSYYYVRVEQADGNLAWASPMWITYQP